MGNIKFLLVTAIMMGFSLTVFFELKAEESAPLEPQATIENGACVDALKARSKILKLESGLNQIVLGQEKLIRSLLISMLTNSHILLEGKSGLGKTTAVKAIANAFSDADFQRIQFRPDLLPGDITGVDRENAEGRMEFEPGPIFANFVLADEINRAYAKTQAALFEAMEEGQVTVGRNSHLLPSKHFVFATQNPLDNEGTNRLPEAQLDRFDMRYVIDYPDEEIELQIARQYRNRRAVEQSIEGTYVLSDLNEGRREMENVEIPIEVEKYILAIVRNTRNLGDLIPEMSDVVSSGASPRATMALMNASQAHAYLEGKGQVEKEDVLSVLNQVLAHRIELSALAIAEEVTQEQVISEIIKKLDETESSGSEE